MSFKMQQVQISDFVISDPNILGPTCCLRPVCLHPSKLLFAQFTQPYLILQNFQQPVYLYIHSPY